MEIPHHVPQSNGLWFYPKLKTRVNLETPKVNSGTRIHTLSITMLTSINQLSACILQLISVLYGVIYTPVNVRGKSCSPYVTNDATVSLTSHPFGDHLLGCSHGQCLLSCLAPRSLRWSRTLHLINLTLVIFTILISISSCPAYFDLSISCVTQFAIISSASSWA